MTPEPRVPPPAFPTASDADGWSGELRRSSNATLEDSIPAPAEAELDRARVVRLPWHRRPMTHWTLAAAAAIAIVAGGIVQNQGPAWHAISAYGEGVAIVDGRPVALGAATDFDQLCRSGTRIVLPEGAEITLRAGDQMLAVITSASDVTVPSTPGRWFARGAIGEVRFGELRLTTGAGFHGASLTLQTPDAQVRVTDATLAVICQPTGTSVCVLEGVARAGPDARATEAVTAGTRAVVFADGRPVLHAPLRDDESPKLGALREMGHNLLVRPAR